MLVNILTIGFYEGGLILHACQYVIQTHVKSRDKYTCRLRRYNCTHDQLNTIDILLSFFRNFFEGGGGRKIQVCPRAPDTLATPLHKRLNKRCVYKYVFP